MPRRKPNLRRGWGNTGFEPPNPQAAEGRGPFWLGLCLTLLSGTPRRKPKLIWRNTSFETRNLHAAEGRGGPADSEQPGLESVGLAIASLTRSPCCRQGRRIPHYTLMFLMPSLGVFFSEFLRQFGLVFFANLGNRSTTPSTRSEKYAFFSFGDLVILEVYRLYRHLLYGPYIDSIHRLYMMLHNAT